MPRNTLARRLLFAAALLVAVPAGATAFADLATLALAAPVVVRATVVKAERLAPHDAGDVAAGAARLLVTAATSAAIVAPEAVPPRLAYLVDVPLDAHRKLPKLAGRDVLLFLRPTAVAGQYGLIDAHAALEWSAPDEAAVRAVLTEERGGSVPVVTGVASAFRVPGAVPGEAESQFFLATRSGKPVSLVVLTRPGEARRLTVALGDVIDDAAAGVRSDTLLWYRLACALPDRLPPRIDAADVADDWRFVRDSLGPCGRTVTAP